MTVQPGPPHTEPPPLDARVIEAACTDRLVGRRVVYKPRVASTNTAAHRLARQGYPSGTVVTTDAQVGGRGRFGRTWHMRGRASIACSVVLRPTLAPSELARLGMAAAIAAVEACCAADVPAQVKWPNDIVVGERKLGGVLCESSLQGTAVQYAIVGIGLNVNDDFRDRPELRATATSIQLFTGRQADRSALLIRLLRELDGWIAETRPPPAVLSAWAARCATVGRTVTVHDARSGHWIASGQALRLESDGALIVRQPSGKTRRFDYAAVSVRHT